MLNGEIRIRVLLATVVILVLAAGHGGPRPAAADSAASDPAGPAAPSPALGPGEVVRIQLDALRRNDETNQGIAVAFRFASPRNKASTGPLPRFIHMIKAGPYRLMLEFDHASYMPIRLQGTHALQRVTLVSRSEVRTFDFLLQRQDGRPCDGCWMTEAVLVVAESGRTA